ncbi:hypothetical protein LEN26_001104 [Aphanomyces euteiches]|nr:hypothetical protein AeMF1_004974 [Aphanomyces euteiches]KAH9162098.1 hypothetical protein LEN26_001104 [Aphanomyces euteiches]KAH9185389.1 hypothetical protein AeNC1_012640 [Aphanomyces euteiches]
MQLEFQPLSQGVQTMLEAGVILAGFVGYYLGSSQVATTTSMSKDVSPTKSKALDRLALEDMPSKVKPIAQDVWADSLYRDLLFRTVSSDQIDGHYIHSLNIEGKYQAFEVYGHPDKKATTSLVHFGTKLCGHPGVVHGGCISTVFDEIFGWTMMWMTGKLGFTANLSVNYRKPLPATTFGIVYTEFDKQEGRKLFMKARLEDNEGNLYSDATALFILPREQA